MKRTKKEIFADKVERTLQLVLNNNGAVIDIGKLHIRRKSARKILESVKNTLDLMGIKYKNIKDSMYLAVPTQAQLEIEKANALSVNSLLAQWPQYFSPRQHGKSYFAGISLGTKDASVDAVIQRKKIHTMIMDDYSKIEERIYAVLSKEKPL